MGRVMDYLLATALHDFEEMENGLGIRVPTSLLTADSCFIVTPSKLIKWKLTDLRGSCGSMSFEFFFFSFV